MASSFLLSLALAWSIPLKVQSTKAALLVNFCLKLGLSTVASTVLMHLLATGWSVFRPFNRTAMHAAWKVLLLFVIIRVIAIDSHGNDTAPLELTGSLGERIKEDSEYVALTLPSDVTLGASGLLMNVGEWVVSPLTICAPLDGPYYGEMLRGLAVACDMSDAPVFETLFSSSSFNCQQPFGDAGGVVDFGVVKEGDGDGPWSKARGVEPPAFILTRGPIFHLLPWLAYIGDAFRAGQLVGFYGSVVEFLVKPGWSLLDRNDVAMASVAFMVSSLLIIYLIGGTLSAIDCVKAVFA